MTITSARPILHRHKIKFPLLRLTGILLCLCITGQTVFPQSAVFNHFTVDNGLPQNSVNHIMRDRMGFMWFATQDGFCRFDGYKFKIYRHEPGKNSLSNNYVWHIYEDKDGIFWISTFGGGLNRFDPATETFYHYQKNDSTGNGLSNDNVFSVVEAGNTIWIATNDGLCSLEKHSGTITSYLQTTGKNKSADNYIGTMAYLQPDQLWLSSEKGLTRFDIKTKQATFFGDTFFNSPVPVSNIKKIAVANDKLIIACDTGLVELDPAKRTGKTILSTGEIRSQEKVAFTGVLPVASGNYWIQTNQGLLFFDPAKNIHTLYQHSEEPGSLSQNLVISVFRSPSGVIWAGTRNGLDKLDREKGEFNLIKQKQGEENTLSFKSVSGIVEAEPGLLWIGTSDGLNAYDLQTKKFTVFKNKPSDKYSISNNYVLAVFKDDKNNIWTGTKGGGLNKLIAEKDPDKTRFQRFLNNQTIQHICQGNDSTLWLGSSGGGLIRFNTQSKLEKSYPSNLNGSGPSHPFVFYVFKDSYENIWLGTATGGLNIFSPEKERFIYIKNDISNFNSLSNNMVLTIFEDKDQQLWVGTAGGLNKMTIPLKPGLFEYFDNRTNINKDSLFVRYGINDGLPNDVIYGILQDDRGYLWLSTNKGIAKFDASLSQPVLKVYDAKDGIQNNEFNQNAFLKNEKGELYFGGVDGLTSFHPDSLKGNTTIPPVVITDFKLYNESVPVNSKGTHGLSLEKAATYTDAIRLAYHHDVITFEFAALNYINPGKNKYQYKLEGFDKEWINTGESRLATYTNLDAGKYIFRVKASNNDGIWNEEGASVQLTVPPPPWLSWYAYTAYISLFLFLVYYFVRQRINAARRKFEMNMQIEKAKTEERESFRRQSSQDFHDEAGNKITKINLFTELAKGEAGDSRSLNDYLDKIYQNTAALSTSMRDFIWSMDPVKDTITETILRLKEFGDSMFTDAGINFVLNGLQPGFNNMKLPMNARRTIIQIFKEAMNNCAKHAKAGTIILAVSINNNILEIKLKDNGTGFETAENNPNSYGLGIMKERAGKIGAKFFIKSQKEKGTEIILQYNLPQMGH